MDLTVELTGWMMGGSAPRQLLLVLMLLSALEGVGLHGTRLTLAAPPNLQLELSEPITIHGPLGRTRQAARVAIHVDDPAALMCLLTTPQVPRTGA